MVQTRHQYNNWVENRRDGYQSGESQCSDCSSQRSTHSNNDYGHGGSDYGGSDDMRSSGPQYRPNDHCKRHRKNDDQPKTNVVRSYTRRG